MHKLYACAHVEKRYHEWYKHCVCARLLKEDIVEVYARAQRKEVPRKYKEIVCARTVEVPRKFKGECVRTFSRKRYHMYGRTVKRGTTKVREVSVRAHNRSKYHKGTGN